MSDSLIIFISLVTVILISLFFGSNNKKGRMSIVNFFWGDSEFKGTQLTQLLISTSFSFNAILYHAWLGYAIGWSAVLIQIIWVISFLLVRKYSREIVDLKQYGTMHGSIDYYFGKKAGMTAAFASIIGFALLIGWEVSIVSESLLSVVTKESNFLVFGLAFLICIIVSTYTMRGGIKGNLNANTIQNALGIIILIGITIFLFIKNDGANTFGVIESMDKMVVTLGVGGLITNIFFSLVWQFVDMSNWQSMASTSDETQVKSGLRLSTLMVFLFPGVIGTVIGIAMTNVSGLNEGTILPMIIEIISYYPIALIFMLIAFFAVMFSTLDGYLLSATQSLSWDIFYKKEIDKAIRKELPENDETSVMNRVTTIIFIIAVIGGIGTLAIHKLGVELFHLVYIVTVAHLALFPTIIVLLVKHKKRLNSKTDVTKKRKWFQFFSFDRFNGFISVMTGLIIGFIMVVLSIVLENSVLLTWSATAGLFSAFVFGLIIPRKK